jgi:purine-nucleoside phosphorylase
MLRGSRIGLRFDEESRTWCSSTSRLAALARVRPPQVLTNTVTLDCELVSTISLSDEGTTPRMPSLRDDWLASAVDLLRSRTSLVPRVGIILGSGLGGFSAEVDAETTLSYREIPGFPVSTAIGHKGQLSLGRFAGVPIAVLEGRFHLYEGYTADQVVRPIHLLQALGVEMLIVTNAAGGLNPGLRMGDVVVVEDHVNLMWTGPLATSAVGRAKLLLSREPGQSFESGTGSAGASPSRFLYDPELAAWALEAARETGTNATRGVYIGMTGPNYETRAEYRWLRRVGDLVGMSTVPEVLAAQSLGMRVLGLSVVSNECNPDALEPTDGATVVAAVSRAEGRLRSIVRAVLSRVDHSR